MSIAFLDDHSLLPMLSDLLPETEEFVATRPISADLVARTVRHGYLPMTPGAFHPDILLIKCHRERMVLEFANLHVPRNTSRYARGLEISIDQDPEGIIDELRTFHEESWISQPLRDALLALHKEPCQGVRILTTEVRDTVTKERVAGELGTLTGGVYTSLSGFHHRNGTGWVQMVGLAVLLRESGVSLWDLGMPIPYKYRLGAHVLGRQAFLASYRDAADTEPRAVPARELPANARELVREANRIST